MLDNIFNRGLAGTAEVPSGFDNEGQPVYGSAAFAVKVLVIESSSAVRDEFGDVAEDTLLLMKSATAITKNTRVVVGGKTYVATQLQVHRNLKNPAVVEAYALGVRGGGI